MLRSASKRFLFIVFGTLLYVTGVGAQSVSGVVVDADNQPLPYASVEVLLLPDSSAVYGVITAEDGTFRIDESDMAKAIECQHKNENNADGRLLKITYVGLEAKYLPYGMNTGTVVMNECAGLLKELVVRGQLPKTRLKGDALVTTVSGTVLEQAGTMDNLLNLIPNVTAKNGSIKVLGRGKATVYINGREMTDEMELERLSPDDIKLVEVVTNPGARYDASVKGVIRIVTKKREGEGFGVDSRSSVSLEDESLWREHERLNLTYRKGGLNLSGLFSVAEFRGTDDKDLGQYTHLEQQWEQTNCLLQDIYRLNLYGKLSASYAFCENNSVGASMSYSRSPKYNYTGTMTSELLKDNKTVETSAVDFYMPEQNTTIRSNAYYVGKVGEWDIDFNTEWYWDKYNERLTNTENYIETGKEEMQNVVNTATDTRSSLIASRLAVTAPLFNGKLMLGGEYSFSKRKSLYNVMPAGVISDDDSRTEESMVSGFMEYCVELKPVNVSAGLRYEYVDFNYYHNNVRVGEQSRIFNNVFPSLAVSAILGKTNVQIGYAADIQRPSYRSLRSSITYANRYTYEGGNPFLVPQINKNVNFAVARGWATFNAVYSHISDPILMNCGSYDNNPAIALMKPDNGKSYDMMSLSLALEPEFGIWHPSLELGVTKQWFCIETSDGVSLGNPMGTMTFTNTFASERIGTFSVIMTGYTEGCNANTRVTRGSFSTDLSYTRRFMNNRLALQLYVTDVFFTASYHAVNYFGPMREAAIYTAPERVIQMTLTYKFNMSKSRYKGTGAGESQLKRM